MRTVDETRSLKELLPKDEKSEPNRHAALIRQSLTDDAARVTALLNSFSDLDLADQLGRLLHTLSPCDYFGNNS
ncbi:hypothetical protein [Ramlibacter sp. WS9]|uniref:hypothetical protein n=1 Tax=Ramlibacter sp. WS9 TaxID=1882741 RepID=UPI001143FE80|nr:hypothetical protein [Ramlibacter sp. WS9]ROZ78239.1 hypothetical protein EEB15_07315 [Ramlibacter sp. WS9]